MSTRFILISQKKEDLDFFTKISVKMNCELHVFPLRDQLYDLLQDRQTIVIMDIDSPDLIPSVQETISNCLPPHRVFAIISSTVVDLPMTSRTATIGHYFFRKYDAFAFNWIPKVIAHVFEKDPLDLQSYLDPGVKAGKIILKEATSRATTLEGVRKILLKKSIHERCVEAIVQALDELLMNAIYDAPIDKKERTYRKALARDTAFPLVEKEEVEVNVILNEQMILLSVRDQFGSFSKNAAMKLIQKDYTNTQYKADAFTQSAGLGLHGIIGSGFGLMLNVQPHIGTHAVLAFPLFKNFKSLRTSFRSFSLNILN